MKYETYFKEYCKKHGYVGSYKYNTGTKEYDVVISKGEDNAGAFLSLKEYTELTEKKLQDILEMLHKGFQAKFNK